GEGPERRSVLADSGRTTRSSGRGGRRQESQAPQLRLAGLRDPIGPVGRRRDVVEAEAALDPGVAEVPDDDRPVACTPTDAVQLSPAAREPEEGRLVRGKSVAVGVQDGAAKPLLEVEWGRTACCECVADCNAPGQGGGQRDEQSKPLHALPPFLTAREPSIPRDDVATVTQCHFRVKGVGNPKGRRLTAKGGGPPQGGPPDSCVKRVTPR